MKFLEQIHARARARRRRIIFPEGADPRIAEAALYLAREELADPIVIGPSDLLVKLAAEQPAITLLEVREDSRRERLGSYLHQRRAARGLSAEEAFLLAGDPLIFAALLVATGEADGSVAGVASTTAEVVRAALWAVGPRAGISTVSSACLMITRAEPGRPSRILTFADPAVVPDPDPRQLAEIALAAATGRAAMVGDEPRVAFLSYSTRGSAGGEKVRKVREAVRIFRERAPHILANGEMQADVALTPELARHKAHDASFARHANILVFPDLDAANIGYKLVERLAGARAIGPLLQGLARPCNDLSRGAAVEDIIEVACMTALMAS